MIISRCFAAVLFSCLGAGVLAADMHSTVSFDISPQPLATALIEFSKQAGVQVMSSGVDLARRDAPRVSGKHTIARALSLLLAGSGLEYNSTGPNTIAITQPTRQEGEGARPGNVEGAAEKALGRTEAATSGRIMALETVTVVGSRLGDAAVNESLPVRVIDSEEIVRSGSTTVAELLQGLPEVSVSVHESDAFLGGGTIRLRGLPIGSTLVLINGRRTTSSGAQGFINFFDLNNVPLTLVERVEVLASGSSAVHGGDALAGVINVVLKEGPVPFEMAAHYGSADGTDEKLFTAAGSLGVGELNVSAVGSYMKRGALLGTERDRTASSDYRAFGGRDFRNNRSNPGNIFSATTQNLPGLNSTFAAVPVGSTGVGLTPADFAATAGTQNMATIIAPFSFLPESERYGVFLHGAYRASPRFEPFAEMMFSSVRQDFVSAFSSLSMVTVPASNPHNPFDVNVRANFQFDSVPVVQEGDTEFLRSVFGARGEISSAWNWELSAYGTRERTRFDVTQFNSAAAIASLANPDPALSLNVFEDGPGGSPELLATFFSLQQQRFEASYAAANGFVRGSVRNLWNSARIALVFGAESAREELTREAPGSALDEGRDYAAAFAEVGVPVFRGSRAGAFPSVDLLAAGRYDRYSDFGTSTTPQAGLKFAINQQFALRGSYSESFRPPALYHLHVPSTTNNVAVLDPRRGGQSTVVASSFGGNPFVQPEEGETSAIGFIWTPRFARGFELQATHWDLTVDRLIAGPTQQFIVDNEALYPGRITRAAPTPLDVAAGRPGQITAVDRTFLNYGVFDLSGTDLGLRYTATTKYGRIAPSVAATYTSKYTGAATPGAPSTDRVSEFDASGYAPRWKGSAGLAWEHRGVELSVLGRYTGRYTKLTEVARELGNLWYVDAYASWDVGARFWDGSDTSMGVKLSVGAVNILDEELDFSGDSGGYDSTQYDLRGRFVYGRVAVTF